MSRPTKTAAAFMSLLVITAAACRHPRPPAANVLVIVVDTLRADRLGAYGNTRRLTPFLDRLAARGAVFTRTYAASSWTCPSVASLLTSRYPSQHHVTTFASRLADSEVTFAERFARSGYLAGGFSANFRLLERLGYAQGFRYWRADVHMPGGLKGSQLRSQSLAWLDRTWSRSSAHPALLYFQYMEPHSPYDPPEPFRSRFARDDAGNEVDQKKGLDALSRAVHAGRTPTPSDVMVFQRLYDAEVATVDDEIRRLFAELERRGFLDGAIVVVTADHGEEFEEHGGVEHGRTLFDECVHVPLILIAPGVAAGQRIEENVSLVDVAPTLLDLAGLAPEGSFEGRSLVPLLRKRPAGSKQETSGWQAADVILQLLPIEFGKDQRVHERGIIRDFAKLLVRTDGGTEAYDLRADPGEKNANPPALAGAASTLAAALDRAATTLTARAAAPVEGETLDAATKEQLRALGYGR